MSAISLSQTVFDSRRLTVDSINKVMVVITEIRKLEFILDFVLGSKFNMDFTQYTTIYKIIKTKGPIITIALH